MRWFLPTTGGQKGTVTQEPLKGPDQLDIQKAMPHLVLVPLFCSSKLEALEYGTTSRSYVDHKTTLLNH